MRQGQTGLKERCRYLVRRPNEIWLQPGEEAPAEVVADEGLSQEELLRQPVNIPYRPLKDPREIRMLDPACGSMHFGLYAFDLYLAIYAEAWEIARSSDDQAEQGEAFAPFVTYAAAFADKAAFLREVPRLILLHNIHGVDIDPRATQIARLTLWLRAQRAWQEQQVELVSRPAITRSNVVCAEPMPGEKELLADFVDQQFTDVERGLVQQLLEAIFDKMQLAGEAGSLLKIEEEIRDAIDQARREWKKLGIQQSNLFSAAELAVLGQVGSSLNADLQSLTKDFWIDIEERIYAALRHYAEQAESGGGFQRRLFAEDASQGFAFIDTCRKRYDVALMNPPFGSMPTNPRLSASMPAESGGNLYAAFVLRSIDFLQDGGTVGCISDRTFLLLPTYQEYRDRLRIAGLTGAADLDWGVLDGAQVATCAYIVGSQRVSSNADIWFIDAREASDKANVVLSACATGNRVVRISERVFETIPTHPLAHWAPPSIRGAFQAHSGFEPTFGIVRKGLSPGDSDRFVKVWWEIPQHEFMLGRRWAPYANGGSFSPFFRAAKEVVDWRQNGEVIRSYCFPDGRPRYVIRSAELYGTPGLTFGKRGETLNVQLLPEGQILSNEGYLILPSDGEASAWLFLAFFNSVVARYLVNMVCGLHKEVGAVKVIPIALEVVSHYPKELIEHAKRAFVAARELKTEETNPEYFPHQILSAEFSTLEELATLYSKRLLVLKITIQDEEKHINRIIGNAFGLSTEDLRTLEADLKLPAEFRLSEVEYEPEAEACDAYRLTAELLSFSFGSVFGRWDIRYPTSKRPAPKLPDPFAPLPACPPGMLQGDDGLPLSPEEGRQLRTEGCYPLDVAWDGILVDDPEHPLDLERRVHAALAVLWGDSADALEHEACALVGVPTLREWFRRAAGFFADHLKRYTKSRRQAPIYWQLLAGSGSYSVWLYYHRLTADTLYKILGIVKLRLEDAEREIGVLGAQGALPVDEAERIKETQSLLQDLRLLKSELDLVAPLWNPNLNDGVIINHAILWRITPYTPWQKKCKECWDKLVGEEYEWAHLAFHLWPERVIRKCLTDRSLAIAHGLEERLWQETNKGNWLQRQVSEVELQALIAEHSKPAVQNALERFLAAPPPVAAARIRAPRAAKSSSTGTTRRPRGSAAVVDAEASRQTLLVLTAAPAEGLGRNAVADLLDVEAASLTAVIKQLKETGQIEQLGAARGAKYRLTEQGRAAVESQAGEDD